MINAMLGGAMIMASLTIALFFLRFWKNTRDRFFLYFALSFALEAVNRILLFLVSSLHTENTPLFYLIRLTAYTLILVAILEKNRRPTIPERHG